MKKFLCVIFSGMFFSACNTIQTADSLESRKLASVSQLSYSVNRQCPVLSQLISAMGQSDATNAVVNILFTKGSDGKYPIDNESCKEAINAYASGICEESPDEVICSVLNDSGLAFFQKIGRMFENEETQEYIDDYASWIKSGAKATAKTILEDKFLVTSISLFTVAGSINVIKKVLNAKAGFIRKIAMFGGSGFLAFSAINQLKKSGIIFSSDKVRNIESSLKEQSDLSNSSIENLTSYLQDTN